VPIRQISKGGYGTVVLAKNKQLNKLVAIKIMKIKDLTRKNAVDKV
jgi:serine/threonine protein kinase